MTNNDTEDRSRTKIGWEGHVITFTSFGFERVVSGLWGGRRGVTVNRAALDDLVDQTQKADAIYCETPEALLLWTVFAGRGLRRVPFVMEDEDVLRSAEKLARWIQKVYSEDRMPEFIADRGNVWMHHTALQREEYLAKGIAPDRLLRMPCSSYYLTMISPAAYRSVRNARSRVKNPAVAESDGSVLCAGVNQRDFDVFVSAAEGLNCKPRVISHEAHPSVRKSDEVKWLGYVPVEEYVAALAAARIVVVTLRGDEHSGGENTITFSMALGKPVIATATIGTVELIKDGKTGILVPQGDSKALKKAIKKLLGDDALRARLGENAKKAEKALAAESRRILTRAFNIVQDQL